MRRSCVEDGHAMTMPGVRCRIGDISVSLRSELPEILLDFQTIYGGTPLGFDDPGDGVRMEVRRAARSRLGRPRYQVYGDGVEIGGARRAKEVFPFLEWGINLRVIDTRPDYLQLHAASLVKGGQGCILAGGSGFGKSTIAAGLMTRGWQYLSDEFALIHRDTHLLHPFPKALCIKEGSFAAVERLGLPFARRRDYVKARKGRVAYISPLDLGSDAIARPSPIRLVILPQYAPEARPHVHRVSPAQALVELAGCTFNRFAFGDRLFTILKKVVDDAACYRLFSNDLEASCRLVESLLPQSKDRADRPIQMDASAIARTPSNGKTQQSPRHSRRDFLRAGAKIAYITPAVLALTPEHAFAAGSNPSGQCSTAVHTGGLCDTDTDCCTGKCSIGICE